MDFSDLTPEQAKLAIIASTPRPADHPCPNCKQPILLNIDTYTRFLCCGAVGHNKCEKEDALQTKKVGSVSDDPACRYCGEDVRHNKGKKGWARLNKWVQRGEAWAQTMVGALYLEDQDTRKQDYVKAKHFLELAIEQENSVAMVNLATMYQEGWGMPVDHTKATELYERAALLGEAVALSRAGWNYYDGRGIKKDKQKSFFYTLIAANFGDEQAQHNVSCKYSLGEGVDKSLEKEKMWLHKAAAQGRVTSILID